MFGKVMSVSDDLMWRYYLLLTDLSAADVDRLQAQVADGARASEAGEGRSGATGSWPIFIRRTMRTSAAAAFEARFTRGELAERSCRRSTIELPEGSIEPARSSSFAAGLATSTSDATRKIQQGAVKVDREKVADIKSRPELIEGRLRARRSRTIKRLQIRPKKVLDCSSRARLPPGRPLGG